MIPKSIKNRWKIWLFRRLALEAFFAGLKLLLELIFASTSGPANLDFEATLWHFLRLFRFPENRIEDDFEVIFDLPKAPQNTQKSIKSAPRSVEKTASKKQTIFYRFFHQKYPPRGPQKSLKIRKSGLSTLGDCTLSSQKCSKERFWTLQSRFWSLWRVIWSLQEPFWQPLGAIFDEKRRNQPIIVGPAECAKRLNKANQPEEKQW